MSNGKYRILVAAGGTGGHLFPALAIVEQLEKLNPNIKFYFIGTSYRIESELIPKLGYEYFSMPIKGFTGISFDLLTLPLKIFKSYIIAKKVIKKKKIDGVLCAGAYLSLPPGIAAAFSKKKLFVMEANVNPGKTVKWLAGKANYIFTSFAESDSYFSERLKKKLKFHGNPVRGFIGELPEKDKARQKFGLDESKKTVLIFGGSLGARSINSAVEKALANISRADYQVLWQTGKNYNLPKAIPQNVVAKTFIEDMASAYAAADLIICRSGATSVAEIALTGKPSVLVPLPSASNDEQAANARALETAKAAIMVSDDKIGEQLSSLLEKLLWDDAKLAKMSAAAKSLAKPEAALDCAKDIIEALDNN